MSKPRREVVGVDRRSRHACVLAETEADRMGAEAKGFAEAITTYYETMVTEGMPVELATDLTKDASWHYWNRATTETYIVCDHDADE